MMHGLREHQFLECMNPDSIIQTQKETQNNDSKKEYEKFEKH